MSTYWQNLPTHTSLDLPMHLQIMDRVTTLRTVAMLCADQVLVCTPGRCGNRGGRSMLHRPLLPPPPKTPITD